MGVGLVVRARARARVGVEEVRAVVHPEHARLERVLSPQRLASAAAQG